MTAIQPIFGDILTRLISNELDIMEAVDECENAHREGQKDLLRAVHFPGDPRYTDAQELYDELIKELAADN